VGLASRERLGIGWIVRGPVEPLELLGLRQDDEIKTLAETPGRRVPRHLQHPVEDVLGYRRLLKLSNHPSPAHRIAKIHASTLAVRPSAINRQSTPRSPWERVWFDMKARH